MLPLFPDRFDANLSSDSNTFYSSNVPRSLGEKMFSSLAPDFFMGELLECMLGESNGIEDVITLIALLLLFCSLPLPPPRGDAFGVAIKVA